MGKKLALGVLIVFASFGVAVAASAGFEWWQSRGDTASHPGSRSTDDGDE